jgi:16S rRNA (guanine966-N2)-methyltransferase
MRSSKSASAGKSVSPSRGARSRELRIVGGAWRGRRFRFTDAAEIRPTPDRVRETLFNWLAPRTPGSHCLDLFAGSGALGLEALSRGAASTVFIERDEVAARDLRARLADWGARGGDVERTDALQYLQRAPRPFDIAFLDPPFGSPLLELAAQSLEQGGWLAHGALVYVECSAAEGLPALPGGWQPLRSKRAGEVGYHLYERGGRGDAAT